MSTRTPPPTGAAAGLPGRVSRPVAGAGPYRLALRRLGSDHTALAFGALFLVIVAMCLAAPLYARYVAHTGPADNHVTDTVRVGGQTRDVVSPSGIPIGPTWQAASSSAPTRTGATSRCGCSTAGATRSRSERSPPRSRCSSRPSPAASAGYFRGGVDSVLSRSLDLIWAYPVVLLGIALGTSLALGGLNLGLFTLSGNSLLVPAFIIGFVYVPYVAKPLRGQVLGLREREFVDAARLQGLGSLRILWSEIAAEPRVHADRVRAAHDRQRDPARGGAVLSRSGRPAAQPVVGNDDRRRDPAAAERDPPHARARAPCSCSRCSGSTSSATACATRSTRTPRSGFGPDGALHRPPADLDRRWSCSRSRWLPS